MRSRVRPGICQVRRTDGGIAGKKFRFIATEPAGIFDKPDGNAGADDAGISAADIGMSFDSRKIAVKIAHDGFQKLNLLASTQTMDDFFSLIQYAHLELTDPLQNYCRLAEDSQMTTLERKSEYWVYYASF